MTLSILFYIDFKGALFSFDLQQGSPKVVTVGALLSLLCNDDGGHKKSAVTLHVVATICFHAMIVLCHWFLQSWVHCHYSFGTAELGSELGWSRPCLSHLKQEWLHT